MGTLYKYRLHFLSKSLIQIIATNIDFVFIVQSVARSFNINRIERYLTICNTAREKPIIILNKIDLISDYELTRLMALIQARIHRIQVISISNESQQGIETMKESLGKVKTYCFFQPFP